MGNSISDKSFLDESLPKLPFFTGEPIIFHHLVINTVLDEHAKSTWSTVPNLTYSATDLEKYYPRLGAMYEQQYRMVVFLSLPAGFKRFGLSNDIQYDVKFQGVFRKFNKFEFNERWELCHVKSKFATSRFVDFSFSHYTNCYTSDIHAIKETVKNISELGGKLICIEMTSLLGKQLEMKEKVTRVRKGENDEMEVDVDVFYEKRVDNVRERFVYEFVSCSLESTIKKGLWHTEVILGEDAHKYLQTGWRIADIFVDNSSCLKSEGFVPKPKENTNCFIIFEKPLSMLEDEMPKYEITMVDKWFKTTNKLHGFSGAEQIITTDWEKLIDHFGKSGWEVIRILKTCDERAHQESFLKYALYTRHLVFFQRQLQRFTRPVDTNLEKERVEIATKPFGGAEGATAENTEPPPSYDDVLAGTYRHNTHF